MIRIIRMRKRNHHSRNARKRSTSRRKNMGMLRTQNRAARAAAKRTTRNKGGRGSFSMKRRTPSPRDSFL